MKLMNKKMLAIVALLNVVGYSFGYEYEISNATDKTLIVRLVERKIGMSSDDQGDQYTVIKQGDKEVVKFPGILCLKAIQAGPYDEEKVKDRGIRNIALMDVTMKMQSSEDKKEAADLTAIEKSTVALIEESLCRNRKFVLMATGEKAKKIIGGKTYNLPFDEIIALTEKNKVDKE